MSAGLLKHGYEELVYKRSDAVSQRVKFAICDFSCFTKVVRTKKTGVVCANIERGARKVAVYRYL